MKRILLPIGLCLTAVVLTGCIAFNVERTDTASNHSQDVVMVPATTADSVAFAEIEAAAKLDFDSSRVSAVNSIAGRTNLSSSAQVCLVNQTLRRLDFESNKMTVFHTLISNPAFSNPAKQTVLVNLNKLGFDSNRADLLGAINQRGELRD
jgi:hypothetical protein